MTQPTPISEPLDDYLQAVVVTLHSAVNQGYKNMADDPGTTQKVLKDCEEILDVILKGDVQEWLQ